MVVVRAKTCGSLNGRTPPNLSLVVGGRDAFDVHRFHLHGHVVAIERGGIELERSAGCDGVFVGGRVQPQAGAERDGFAQFMLLESDERIVQRRHRPFPL